MAQSYQVDIVTKVVGASSVAKLERSLENLTAEQNKVDRASVKAANGIRTFNTSARAAGTSSKAAASGVQNLGAAINAAAAKITAIVTAVQTFGRVMSTTFERENAEQRLKNLTGSTEEYEAALLAAASVSQKFGISQTEATKALGDVYSRLSGVGYGLKEVTTIYQGFNAVARESGVSSEAASAAFLQLGQAMGSGVLQGDELRSILEQMPQLTQLIAQEMGIAAGQVKAFGAEGKITSDVIFAALQNASQGATDLNGKLTPTQQAFNNFNKAIDNASVALGRTLVPALTSLIEAITPVIEAVGLLGQKLNELGVSKVFEFLMAPAAAFGELINGATENTEDLSGKAAQAVESFSGLPVPIESAKAKTEKLKEETQKLAAAQREYQAALSTESGDIDRKLQVTQAVLAAERQINDAKLQQANADLQAASNQAEREAAAQRIYELTISNAKLEYKATLAAANAEMQKVEAALKHATVLQKQIKAEVSLAQSKGVYNDKQQEAITNANALVQEAEKNLQAQGQINQSIEAGAAAQLDAKTKAAQTALEANRIKQNTDGAVASANNLAAAYDRAAGAAGNAAAAAAAVSGQFAGSSTSANYSSQIYDKYKLDESGNIVQTTADERRRQMNAAKVADANNLDRQVQAWDKAFQGTDYYGNASAVHRYGGMTGVIGSQMHNAYTSMYGNFDDYADYYRRLRPMAEGGYVTGPTNAIVGEGGEPEYVIPASKLDGAMQRYSAGMRGSSMIPDSANVNVNYSGSTVDMGGTSYVNKGDVTGIVSQAVNQTLTTLQRSAGARLKAGMR